jgi:DNA-binding beta-propeller fold protein YncE
MTLLPDNNTLFVTGMNSNRSWAVRLSSREVLKTYEFAIPRPFGISSSSDGSRVYISCTNNRPEKGMVYAIDPVTLNKVDSVQAGSEPFGLQWRPLIAGEN